MNIEMAAPLGAFGRDAELVARAQRGDLVAFEDLIRSRLDRLFRTACGILGDPSEAEDAVQEASITAWQKLPTLRSQMGRGLTPIDPATNTAGERAGTYPTCGGPVVAVGSIWQMACDSGQIIRVDLATGKAADIYADEYAGVGLVGDTLVAVGPNAIARVDPETSTLEEIAPGVDGFPIGYDDRSVWLASPGGVQRISIDDGKVLATLPIGGDTTVTLAGDRAWVTQFGLATHEVDVATNTVLRTIHLDRPAVAREIDGTVWFTSFDTNSLGRFQP